MKISENLKKLRTERNISQTTMAQKLNISRQAYNHYETGRNMPPPDSLVKIANFFDVSTDYILQKTDDPTPAKKIKQSKKEKEGENMKNEDLNGKPVTQAQFNKAVKNLATKDDINKLLQAINSIQVNTESGQDEPAFKN